jgi:hypothetical protein
MCSVAKIYFSAWEAVVLPLNYARVVMSIAKRGGAQQGRRAGLQWGRTPALLELSLAVVVALDFGVLSA